MTAPAPEWYPDPTGRHEHRYWDGQRWTEHVADGGVQLADPLPADAAGDAPRQPEPDAGSAVPAEAEVPADPAPPTTTDPAPPTMAAAARPAAGGVRSDLLDGGYAETGSGEVVILQNRKMLKVTLGPDVYARQGAMVAFQGAVDFDYQGSGVGKFLKKALTGEGLPLMRCSGRGEVFLANDADDVHILWLEGAGITVNGHNILAFDPALTWDVERVKGVGMLAGGLFNTTLTGSGWVAITTHGTPVALRTDQPTFADVDAAVAWSTSLRTTVNRTVKAGALIGRGSGEAAQLAFQGDGFVIVQASEGATVPPHSHGNS